MDPMKLPVWQCDLSAPGIGPLGTAFAGAFSDRELQHHAATGGSRVSVAAATPAVELRYSIHIIAHTLDKEMDGLHVSGRFLFQDQDAFNWAILVDVVGAPRLAPPDTGYRGQVAAVQGSLPLIPVRFWSNKISKDSMSMLDAAACMEIINMSCRDANEMGLGYTMTKTTDCSMEELQLMQDALEENAAKIDPAVQAAFQASPLGHRGLLKLSFITVLPPSDAGKAQPYAPDPETGGPTPPCHADGCSKPGELRCSGCKGAYYCSAACQKSDWKARHKRDCQSSKGKPTQAEGQEGASPSAADTALPYRTSVLLPLGSKLAGVRDGIRMDTSSSIGGVARAATVGMVPASYHKAEFVVKVQAPLVDVSTEPADKVLMLLYDQHKTLHEMVNLACAQGQQMFKFIVEHGGPKRKVYLQAKREGDELRVFLDKALPWPEW